MKLKFNVTAEGKTIGAMIENFSKRANALVNDLTVIAASVVLHAIKHGNVTPARAIVNVLGTKETPWRSNAMISWFEAVGPFVYNKETKTLDYDSSLIDQYKAALAADENAFIKALMDEPFFKFKPQAEFKGFDLKAELKKLLTKAENAKEKHADTGKVNVNGLEEIERAFVATFGG